MVERQGAAVSREQDERGAVHRRLDLEAGADALGECGLAGAERALEQQHVARTQQARDAPAERACTRDARGRERQSRRGAHRVSGRN